ncbi:MAG TPA: hypothetical protein VLN42_09650 [Casimicrobiaceae bacterium]|nr:hypothetical protein [Casimicrobiaceae bacterium]
MNVVSAGTLLLLALWATAGGAAERAIYTVVDGDVRVLRKTTWYRLEAGARAESGDVIDAGERAQAQLELAHGATLSIMGPALVGAAELPSGDGKSAATPELTLLRGWVKASNAPKAAPLRLVLPSSALRIANGVAVVHCDAAQSGFFVETGSVTLTTPAARGREVAREAREGEFWHRTGDRAFESEDHPSPAFIAAMPTALRDRLPSLASRFETAPPPSLPAGREVTYAEAEPWLAGATRKAFAKRFASRLADPAFRAAAAAARPPVPEWDRTLHPERYRPREPEDAGRVVAPSANR